MAELTVPPLSVVVAVYNRAQTLERRLSAVCAQLGSSDELIVVGDGSTDDVGAVANRCMVILVRLDRQSGVAAARVRAHFNASSIDSGIGSYGAARVGA